MPKTIHARNVNSDMDSVRAFLEENLKLGDQGKQMISLLITEELITRLLQSGNDEVSVSVRGRMFPRVVLVSQLPMDDDQNLMNKSEDDRIETEIRRDILKQYEAYIDQEQGEGQIVYSVHSVRKTGTASRRISSGTMSGRDSVKTESRRICCTSWQERTAPWSACRCSTGLSSISVPCCCRCSHRG